MTEILKLHERLGLHQEVSLFYVVDGYVAILSEENGADVEGEPCETIYLALLSLEDKL